MNARIVLATVLLGVAGFPAMAQQNTWDLCPQPTAALNSVPANIDQLQADIDRFTLCLNRAELLLKLEDLKTQNTRDGATSTAGGMDLPIEPMPLNAQQAGQLLGADTQAAAPAAPLDTGLTSPDSVVSKKEAPPEKDYVIREVRGLGGGLVARVQSPDGNYEQVKIGDKLADGATVTAINTTQVTVQTKDGAVKRLGWED